jgi:hypothetical protein
MNTPLRRIGGGRADASKVVRAELVAGFPPSRRLPAYLPTYLAALLVFEPSVARRASRFTDREAFLVLPIPTSNFVVLELARDGIEDRPAIS